MSEQEKQRQPPIRDAATRHMARVILAEFRKQECPRGSAGKAERSFTCQS